VNSIFLRAAIVTVVAAVVGYVLAHIILRPRTDRATEPGRPAEPHDGPVFSARGRRIYHFIIFFVLLTGWFQLVRWWADEIAAGPNGGLLLVRWGKEDLQYGVGIPLAIFATVIVTYLLRRLFAPEGYARERRAAAAAGQVNVAAAHPIAALVVIAVLGCYTALNLTCYTRFDKDELIFRPPWSVRTRAYPYSRVRAALLQRRGDGDKNEAARFAVVFDDGRVWWRDDYGSPDRELDLIVRIVCNLATTLRPCPTEVDSIDAEVARLAGSERAGGEGR
jgi:hypothetical protein